jgi:hypothetical protein
VREELQRGRPRPGFADRDVDKRIFHELADFALQSTSGITLTR